MDGRRTRGTRAGLSARRCRLSVRSSRSSRVRGATPSSRSAGRLESSWASSRSRARCSSATTAG
eukprot:3716449-Pyramimonas_sp.AAC.1